MSALMLRRPLTRLWWRITDAWADLRLWWRERLP